MGNCSYISSSPVSRLKLRSLLQKVILIVDENITDPTYWCNLKDIVYKLLSFYEIPHDKSIYKEWVQNGVVKICGEIDLDWLDTSRQGNFTQHIEHICKQLCLTNNMFVFVFTSSVDTSLIEKVNCLFSKYNNASKMGLIIHNSKIPDLSEKKGKHIHFVNYNKKSQYIHSLTDKMAYH
jgi:hypothetical protein